MDKWKIRVETPIVYPREICLLCNADSIAVGSIKPVVSADLHEIYLG